MRERNRTAAVADDLFELVVASGVAMDRRVHLKIVELIRLDVPPQAIVALLRELGRAASPTSAISPPAVSPGGAAGSPTAGSPTDLSPTQRTSHIMKLD
ncbi:hypothetical protein HK105_203183 [Polyrhizophydium stewartii]|uniref:Mitotic-spindle organizing protein 1 n=1 Tax=Polyrhizophydium stewartii TaxID=2732419 RepID=A0ABR4NCF9_9FUNG